MTNQQREKNKFSKHIVISVTGTKSVKIDYQLCQIEDHLHQNCLQCTKSLLHKLHCQPLQQKRARCIQNVDPVQQDTPPPPPTQAPDPVQPPTPPAQVPNPVQLQLNWSYFKPVFSGKTEKDAEDHLLRTNDWMETHNFPEVAKVHRFGLTLTGEARLWYVV